MLDNTPFLLCLIIPALVVIGVLALIISRAPTGKETPGVGFERTDRTPKG